MELLGIARDLSRDCVCQTAGSRPTLVIGYQCDVSELRAASTLIGFVVIRQLPIFSGHPTPRSLTKFQSASRTTAISCSIACFNNEFPFNSPSPTPHRPPPSSQQH